MSPVAAPVRARDSVQTRAALLAAARSRFAHSSFDAASLWEIGADARADPALIARYFGGKEKLFAQVLATAHDPAPLVEEDVAGFADRAARAVVLGDWKQAGLGGLRIALRSASSPQVSDAVRRWVERRYVEPLAEGFGGPEALTRARLVFACIDGVARLYGLRSADRAWRAPKPARVIASRFVRDLSAMAARPFPEPNCTETA